MSSLAVGDSVGTLVVAVEPGPMKLIAALQDDPNPIHWDTAAAARAGLGDRVVNQGPATMSYLLRLAAQAAGDYAGVREFRVRFLASVFAGDLVECAGTVAAVDAGVAELELAATVAGQPVATAVAMIIHQHDR